jgi:hypothetical protein
MTLVCEDACGSIMKEAFDDGPRTATTKQHDWKRKMKDCPEAEDGAEDDLM